jgi:hypothetical protein
VYDSIQSAYRDSSLLFLDHELYNYQINFASQCLRAKDYASAERSLLPLLATTAPDTRAYAMLTSVLAQVYQAMGNAEKEKEYLVRSAISDIQSSVKENISIRQLAFLLLNDGDITHSNAYIKKSLDDANFYNARLRNVQIVKLLPVIDKAYQLEREKYQQKLKASMVAIGVLVFFLAGLAVYLYRLVKKLAKTRKEVIRANKDLKKANNNLLETNHVKEEYIGRFLNQCSVYIDKLEAYRKALNKKAANGKLEELYTMLKSSQIIEDELKDFYQTFDSTFIHLFPNFVAEFNQLLPPEERIHPKGEEVLTVELRVFALIRLGITDSAKIANFLRYSITTIYNYRSKYRSKSLIPRDKFEETVMKIGYGNN